MPKDDDDLRYCDLQNQLFELHESKSWFVFGRIRGLACEAGDAISQLAFEAREAAELRKALHWKKMECDGLVESLRETNSQAKQALDAQGYLNTSLTGEVEKLRMEKEAIRDELNRALGILSTLSDVLLGEGNNAS